VAAAARRRRDARLFIVSLAFGAASGFLGLHALATPGVLLGGTNAGFELATPVGLVLGGVLAALSGLELGPGASARVIRLSVPLMGALAAVLVVWAAVSVSEVPPLDATLGGEELDGWQISLAVVGVLAYAAAALGYLRLYRRRRSAFLLVVTLAFALLAEAMVVVAWARNWQLSWWEWHLLMLLAFAAIAVAARREWPEERFSALYLERTLAGARDVSILFADLQGFTSFSERTSPDQVGAMLNAYFARIVPLMEELDGEVHQLIGDAVMVVFNKDGGQPDHARLAAHAGLALQEAAADVAGDHPDWPRFRVGVNSGPVLAGVVGGERGHRKHGVVGDTVNLAARLEGKAPVGRVVLGAETVQQLPEGAVVERLPELHVKGKEAPIEAYLLHDLG
jgi:adenylate cyclase